MKGNGRKDGPSLSHLVPLNGIHYFRSSSRIHSRIQLGGATEKRFAVGKEQLRFTANSHSAESSTSVGFQKPK
jgi:hypothetical protein